MLLSTSESRQSGQAPAAQPPRQAARSSDRVGSWDWDLCADRVSWSDELYRLFGLDPQTRHGGFDVFLSLLDAGEREAAESAVRDACATGQIFVFDHRIRLANGAVRILESRGQVLLDGDGVPVRMVGTVEDVTDARHATQELPLAERRLQDSAAGLRRREQLLDLLDAVASAANASGSFEEAVADAMRQVVSVTGWTVGHALVRDDHRDELVSLQFIVSGDVDVAPLLEASRRSFRWGEGLPGRVWESGHAVWVADVASDGGFLRAAAAVASGLRGAVGVPVRAGTEVGAVLEFFTDADANPPPELLRALEHIGSELGRVLERERADRAIAAHERRFHSLIADASEIVAILGRDGVVRYLNPSAAQILGVDPIAAPDSAATRVHPEDLEEVRAALAALGPASGERARFEFRVRGADGAWRHLDTVATNLLDDPDIGGFVLHCRDVTDQRAVESELEYKRLHDPLTGCPNRSLFTTLVQRALRRERRYHRGVAVFAIDLDRFQSVNEQHGHDVGDAVLVVVAQRIEQALRSYDTVSRPGPVVARLGGDEFFALCEDVGTDVDVAAIGRRLATATAEPLVVEGNTIAIGATVGAAVNRGGDVDIAQMLVHAETAVRRAKSKSTLVELFDAGAAEAVVVRDADVAALREAIASGQFRLHYQPKVDSQSGQLQGVEALVRWEHPTRGLVPPVEFISLAEESGLIGALGEWVLIEACQQQARWARELGTDAPPMVCVNVSGHQLVAGFADVVRRIIAESGVVGEMLCLEITESAVMGDVDAAVDIVRELKAVGLIVSIDDFGTGYSSLSHLKRFPIDELKIDKSFIDGLGTDPEDTAIVAAIVAMAHALGLLVIAEGVETVDQLHHLQNLGCELVQGYLFSPPLPPDRLPALGSVLRPAAETGSPGPEQAAEVVLVVDDTADVRQLARVSLTTSGFEVLEAASGDEALEEAARGRPACIVLDVSMPGMNGFDTCRALRSDPATAGIAIVMLTSKADPTDKIEAFSAGADDYMVKPFAPRELVSRIRQALARRAAGS